MTSDDDQEFDFSDPTVTETLAQRLGVSVADFVEAFGAGWRPLPDEGHDFDSDPSGMGNMFGPWFVAGEPFQLALRPNDCGVELGVPVGRWGGSHTVHWQSHDRQTVYGTGQGLLDAAPAVVAEVLKRRRSKFRYCRYCRCLTPPEERLEANICYGCGTKWHGMVY